MQSPIYRTHSNGARQVFDRLRYIARQESAGRHSAGRDLMTCGHCGRTWDDAHVSAVTPTPAGRCPFEHLHETPRTRLQPAAPAPLALQLDRAEAAELFECLEYDTGDLMTLVIEEEDRPRLARLEAIRDRLAAMLDAAGISRP